MTNAAEAATIYLVTGYSSLRELLTPCMNDDLVTSQAQHQLEKKRQERDRKEPRGAPSRSSLLVRRNGRGLGSSVGHRWRVL